MWLPGKRCFDCIEDFDGGGYDFRADTVTLNQRYGYLVADNGFLTLYRALLE